MKKLIYILTFLTPNISFGQSISEIGSGYFNGHIFAEFTTPSSTGPSSATLSPILGNLDGNNFTITYTTTVGLHNFYLSSPEVPIPGAAIIPNFSPGGMPADSGFPSPGVSMVDLNWHAASSSSGTGGLVYFSNNLDVWDHIYAVDIDTKEEVIFEFLDQYGNPVSISDNIRIVNLSNISSAYDAPVYVTSSGTAVHINYNATVENNGPSQGYAFVVLTNNIRKVRFTQIDDRTEGSPANSWNFTFSKGALDRGDAPLSYGDAGHLPLHALLRLGDLGGDTEQNAFYSSEANGDNYDAENDEDGVVAITPIIKEGTSTQFLPTYSITTSATNQSGIDATAIAWIDWNNNGTFDLGENAAPIIIPSGSDNIDITFIWPDVTISDLDNKLGTFLRIRLSNGDDLSISTPNGESNGIGETEDYYIPYHTTISGIVFHDADGMTGGVDGTELEGIEVTMYASDGVTVIATTTTDINGDYTFIVPSSNNENIIKITLPTGFDNISSTDDTPLDGEISVTLTNSSSDNNFGIQQPPTADDKEFNVPNIAFSTTSPEDFPEVTGYLTIPASSSYLTGYLNDGSLSGSDPEDCPGEEECNTSTGTTFNIENINSNTKLYYDFGTPGSPNIQEIIPGVNGEITNFDVTKLVIYGQEGTGTESNPIGFTYSMTDKAGFTSSPAEYIIKSTFPLSVNWLYFSAIKSNGGVLLSWATATETYNKGYEVEHSNNSNDWTSKGFIPTKSHNGNSNTILEYTFTDNHPIQGINYYRLKQIDIDGKYAYSVVKHVVFDNSEISSIYPNPTHDYVSISGLEGNEIIKLMDVTGRIVKELNATNSVMNINLADLPSGTYQLIIYSSSKIVLSEKLIKL